jgi:methionyl-tRNA synthetase
MDETKPEAQNEKPAEAAKPEPKKLSYDKFMNVELHVARIVEAARVEGTDKLMQLQLDVGELGPRQIFAGISQAD